MLKRLISKWLLQLFIVERSLAFNYTSPAFVVLVHTNDKEVIHAEVLLKISQCEQELFSLPKLLFPQLDTYSYTRAHTHTQTTHTQKSLTHTIYAHTHAKIHINVLS